MQHSGQEHIQDKNKNKSIFAESIQIRKPREMIKRAKYNIKMLKVEKLDVCHTSEENSWSLLKQQSGKISLTNASRLIPIKSVIVFNPSVAFCQCQSTFTFWPHHLTLVYICMPVQESECEDIMRPPGLISLPWDSKCIIDPSIHARTMRSWREKQSILQRKGVYWHEDMR